MGRVIHGVAAQAPDTPILDPPVLAWRYMTSIVHSSSESVLMSMSYVVILAAIHLPRFSVMSRRTFI